MIAFARSSNSSFVFFFCFFKVVATSESGLFFQSYNLSIWKRFFLRNISETFRTLGNLINVKNSRKFLMCIIYVQKCELLRCFIIPKAPRGLTASPLQLETAEVRAAHPPFICKRWDLKMVLGGHYHASGIPEWFWKTSSQKQGLLQQVPSPGNLHTIKTENNSSLSQRTAHFVLLFKLGFNLFSWSNNYFPLLF